MKSIWSRAVRAFPKSLLHLSELLSPAFQKCLICGKHDRISSRSRFLTLCTECYRNIPWIQKVVCSICGRPSDCPDCKRRKDTAFISSRSAVSYDSTIRQWLALYKYRGHEALAPLLAEILAVAYRRLKVELSTGRPDFNFDALIPVPVSDERLLERGFNQAERLSAYLTDEYDVPLFGILRRMRHTEKQSLKTRNARLRDSENVFHASPGSTRFMIDAICTRRKLQLRKSDRGIDNLIHLLIIDDIYTTGSTVQACAHSISKTIAASFPDMDAAIRIYVLTLARS